MPYRDATFTEQPRVPPWWQRVWYCVDRTGACEHWQWARQAAGGRWTRDLAPFKFLTVEWRRVVWCPAFGQRPRTERDRFHRVLGFCTPNRCRCEVYP